MPKVVYANVEDFRMIDNGRIAEDVTSVTPPNVTHPTADMNSAGMSGVVRMPNPVKVEAMEFVVNHNNGSNCERLSDPGIHTMEFRIARGKYTVAKGRMDHEGVKYRVTGVHLATEESQVEPGNPLASTERYSLLRYEKIVNGTTTTLVDLMAGNIKKNGKDMTNDVQSLLK